MTIPHLVAAMWPVLTRSPEEGGPCPKAVAWLCSLPAETTPEQAIALCPEPGWLVWLFARSGPDGAAPPSGGAIMATLAYGEGPLWLAETEEQRIHHGVRGNLQLLADLRADGAERVDALVVSLLHRDEGTLGRVRAALWPAALWSEMGAT